MNATFNPGFLKVIQACCLNCNNLSEKMFYVYVLCFYVLWPITPMTITITLNNFHVLDKVGVLIGPSTAPWAKRSGWLGSGPELLDILSVGRLQRECLLYLGLLIM